MRRIAITGSSGYYGRIMLAELRRRDSEVRALGIDCLPPMVAAKDDGPDEFQQLDVRDASLAGVLRAFAPDTVLHFAYVVDPIRDRAEMRSVNVDGTRNVLASVAACRPARFLLSSSATAYGAWPDNPVPIEEDWPIRRRAGFAYAADKAEVERLVAEFAAAHEEIAASWTRPAIICGATAENYLTSLFLTVPFMVKSDGHDTPMQFVHERDVAAATYEILVRGGRGPFNIAPNDHLTQSEIAAEMNIRSVSMPLWLLRAVTSAWWTLRLPMMKFPPGLVYYLRYPWVVRPARLERELGFEFAHTSRDAFREMLDEHERWKAKR
jgi:UDP-glucose 4-epimerase